MNDYSKLTRDLKVAVENAKIKAALNKDDGGTCNFDSMMLFLPRWSRDEVKAAAERAGLRCWYEKSWSAFIFTVPVPAQGDCRTEQAEEMHRTMQELGYRSGVYYQMD